MRFMQIMQIENKQIGYLKSKSSFCHNFKAPSDHLSYLKGAIKMQKLQNGRLKW